MTMDLTGMTGEQQAQALVAQGWTWDQVRAQYPQLFGAAGAGVKISAGVGPGALGPFVGAGVMTLEEQVARGWADPGGGGTAPVGAGLPAGVAGGLAALGVSAASIGTIGLLYAATQAVGLQYPWETGPGEGFISPFTRDIVQDESGMWVTRETRPDLFAANGGGAMVPFAGAGIGAGVVKQWSANGWPFAMTSDGYIHTVTKSGLRKRWKPYKSVVLGKNPSPRMLGRAIKKFEKFEDLHDRIQAIARKLAPQKTRTVYVGKK